MGATVEIYFASSVLYGSALISNGEFRSTVAVNGPFTFEGSRHESEHEPPHPYWNWNVLSYEPSAFLMRSFGAGGCEPAIDRLTRSPDFPVRRSLK